jgi:hypothetical protein
MHSKAISSASKQIFAGSGYTDKQQDGFIKLVNLKHCNGYMGGRRVIM